MTATNTIGRQVVVPLTNKSGGSVAAGDVVYLNDGSNADSFTTGTTSARTGGVGIAQQTIASNATGLVLVSGYASLVNVNASVTIGHYGSTYTVAKQATDAGASRAAGTFCQFQTGGTTPDAIIWQPDLGGGSGMTNPMTTTQDIIVGGASGTPGRLAIGAAGGHLASINGALAYDSGTSFPGSAVTGDRYWRTDRALEYTYDGTRWVTVSEYALTGSTNVLQGFTTTGTRTTWIPVGTYDLWVVRLELSTFVATTNTGSAFWTIDLMKETSALAQTSLGNANTSADSPSTFTRHNVTIGALVDRTTYPVLTVVGTKTSTPGACTLGATVIARLVG